MTRIAAAIAVVATFETAHALTKYPTVTAHGMGDSCFNGGMKRTSHLLGHNLNRMS